MNLFGQQYRIILYADHGVLQMYEVIVNPGARSGRGVKIWEGVEAALKAAGAEYQVHYTKKFTEGGGIVSGLCSKYRDEGRTLHLIVFGGDGTVNGVLQKIDSFENVILTVIPIGSSNDLARGLKLERDPYKAITHMLNDPTDLHVDIGYVHCENELTREGSASAPDRKFIVSTGIGYDAAVCEEAMNSGIKDFFNKIGLGKLTYLGVALKQLLGMKCTNAELTIEGEAPIRLENLIFIAGMNHAYEGGGFMFGPEAVNNDGKLELCVASDVPKGRILKIMPKALKGEHFKYDGIDHYRASEYTVKTDAPLWVHSDGEVSTKADYIKVSVAKEALHMIY